MKNIRLLFLFLTVFCNFKILANHEKDVVNKVEKYLNGITTFQADFLQIDENGEESKGKLFISRPGKLRWQYDSPDKIAIVINGSLITYYEFDLKQSSHTSTSNNMANFLARKHVSFKEDVVLKKYEIKAQMIYLDLEKSNQEMISKVRLILSLDPIHLKKIEFIDENDNFRYITLKNLKYGSIIDNSLFKANQIDVNIR